MRPFYLDLGERQRKSKLKLALQIVVGAGWVIAGAALGAIGFEGRRNLEFYDGLFQVIIGLAWLMGVVVAQKSKWYFKVDETCIEYRPQLGRLKRFDWKNIERVEMKTGKALLRLRDGRTDTLRLNMFSYQDHLAIRDAIKGAADEQHLLS